MFIAIPMSISNTQFYINQAYVRYVTNSGYIPILVEPEGNIDYYANICGGLLLPGGVDIDPTYYGEDNYYSTNVDPVKDMFERSLLHAFIERQKPVFGICRGFQLISREFLSINNYNKKKSVIKYNQNIGGHNSPTALNTSRTTPTHSILALSESLWGVQSKFKKNKYFVNSMHHQALTISEKDLFGQEDNKKTTIFNHNNFNILAYTTYHKIEAKADVSYIIEAADIIINNTTIRGVQWHPEELNDCLLLRRYFDKNNADNNIENIEVTQ